MESRIVDISNGREEWVFRRCVYSVMDWRTEELAELYHYHYQANIDNESYSSKNPTD